MDCLRWQSSQRQDAHGDVSSPRHLRVDAGDVVARARRGEKRRARIPGAADLLRRFNWVVKSNPELFQECQDVIPLVCLQEEPSSQGRCQTVSERNERQAGGGGR